MMADNFLMFFLQKSLVLESFGLKYFALLFYFLKLCFCPLKLFAKFRGHWDQLNSFNLLFKYVGNAFFIFF